jgi:hypothetical protein
MALTQVIGSGIGQVTDIKIGGSGSANTLEDYEEGTWTPADGSGASLSFTVYTAYYIKVGDLVHVNAYIDIPPNSNGNNLAVSGLPFASKSYAPLSLNSNSANGHVCQVNAGNSFFYVKQENNTTNVNSAFSDGFMVFGGTYRINF